MDHEEIPNYGNRYVFYIKEELWTKPEQERANSPTPLKHVSDQS
jgi:hypothetical protein